MSCHYICKTCGEDFNEAELKHGTCPNCESDDIFEAEICENCHEWKIADDMIGDFCPDCAEAILNSYSYDPERIYKVTKNDKTKIEISDFLACCFDSSEIERILLDKISEQAKVSKMYGGSYYKFDWYMNDDKEWFLERVKEKGELCKEETEQTA